LNRTPETANTLAGATNKNMLRLVSLQLIVTIVAGLAAGLIGGWAAMVSAIFGGLCCVVPNAIMAGRLFLNTKRAGGADPISFFIWEFIKIALTVALIGAAATLYRDLNWFALLGGFIVALKSYIILLFRH
jgi:ATP synthase protein I